MTSPLNAILAGIVLVGTCAALSVADEPRTVIGDAYGVASGGMIWVGPDTARVPVILWGVKAPKLDEKCSDRYGRRYSCGLESAKTLFTMISRDRRVTCEIRARDEQYRAIGICRNSAGDLAGRLVAQGWATADSPYYRDHEEAARREGLGLHQDRRLP